MLHWCPAGVSCLECADGRSIVNVLPLQVLQKAVCPEKRRGMDTAESAIASVTEVRITSDLQVDAGHALHFVSTCPMCTASTVRLVTSLLGAQVAKVYISVFSDPRGKALAMEQLAKLQP